jgi:hypothetical protein
VRQLHIARALLFGSLNGIVVEFFAEAFFGSPLYYIRQNLGWAVIGSFLPGNAVADRARTFGAVHTCIFLWGHALPPVLGFIGSATVTLSHKTVN